MNHITGQRTSQRPWKETWFRAGCRPTGSYPETGFREVERIRNNHGLGGVGGARFRRSSDRRITHANHPRSTRLWRIFQCLAVPRQPLKLLETLEIRVLKRLASAVQLRPWHQISGYAGQSSGLRKPTYVIGS